VVVIALRALVTGSISGCLSQAAEWKPKKNLLLFEYDTLLNR
jgi:hypothetical protein